MIWNLLGAILRWRPILALTNRLDRWVARENTRKSLAKLRPGDFYWILDVYRDWYYSTCSTTGSTIWVEDPNDAEIVGSGEARQLMEFCLKHSLGYWRLVQLPRGHPKHPHGRCIPAVTQHFTMHETPQGKWFCRARVDQFTYETIAWSDRFEAEKDAKAGRMYNHVRNVEKHPPDIISFSGGAGEPRSNQTRD